MAEVIDFNSIKHLSNDEMEHIEDVFQTFLQNIGIDNVDITTEDGDIILNNPLQVELIRNKLSKL